MDDFRDNFSALLVGEFQRILTKGHNGQGKNIVSIGSSESVATLRNALERYWNTTEEIDIELSVDDWFVQMFPTDNTNTHLDVFMFLGGNSMTSLDLRVDIRKLFGPLELVVGWDMMGDRTPKWSIA